MRFLVLSLLISLLAGCGGRTQAPPPTDEAASECGLTLDNLAGRTFIHLNKDAPGKFSDDPLARAYFFSEGGKTKVRYNTRHPTDFYTYTCEKMEGQEKLLCKEDNPKPVAYCKSLWANDLGCDPQRLVELTGCTLEEAQKAREEVDEEITRLKKNKKLQKELDDMKMVFNHPNNQLRGLVYVKIRHRECQLLLQDRYETINLGQVRELENVLGTAYFGETKKEYILEHCTDDKNLIAVDKPDAWFNPGDTRYRWRTGDTVYFRYVGPEDQTPKPGCTYTMDLWADWEPTAKGQAVPVKDGKLQWVFNKRYDQPGRLPYFVHMTRYRACGAESPQRISFSCQGVIIE
ncbi:MAG: hypothetical protein JXB39_13740 [Deltaproteobacteria bacterium]|nr:hypothetical protein [Deltaproteobacteria bacterium]